MTMTVAVRGVGAAKVRPDRAVIALELARVASTPAEALRDVADRTTALEGILRERGVPPTDWTTAGVSVAPAYEWRNNQQVLVGHRAANRVQVTTADGGLVGRLLTEAVEVLGARVGGPDWLIDRSNPAHLEACREAAADARRRAAAYAEGLGLVLGPVVTVDETDRDTGPGPAPRMMAMAARAADESAALDVNPGEHEVAAEVVVTFTLLPSAAAG